MNTLLKQTARFAAFSSVACLFAAGTARAELIAYEGFDTDPGEIDGAEGETSFGWEDVWWSYDLDSQETFHGVSDEGLSYPGLATTGNAFLVENEPDANTTTTYRQLPQMYTAGAATGEIWVSTLIQPVIEGDPAAGGFIQLSLADNTESPYNKGFLGIGWAGTAWTGGGERVETDMVSGTDLVTGETAFLVVKIDFDNSEMSFWVNPDPTLEDPGVPVGTSAIEDNRFQFDRVAPWAGHYGPSVEQDGADFIGSRVDEIRIGETWADVSPTGDGGDGGDEPTTWADYDVVEGTGWVDTGVDYLGWLWVGEEADQSWVYSYELGTYLYLPETHVMTEGSWAYAIDLDTWDYGTGFAPSLQLEALDTWIYVPGYTDSAPAASWVYFWNSAEL